MGSGELIVVFAAILVLFGAKKIPEFAKGLGQGIKEFKKASRDVTEEFNNATVDNLPPPSQAQIPASVSAPKPSPAATVPKA